jgi:hypothetical protein
MSNHQFQSKTAVIISDFGTSFRIVGQMGKRINVQKKKIRREQTEATFPEPRNRPNSAWSSAPKFAVFLQKTGNFADFAWSGVFVPAVYSPLETGAKYRI